MQTAAGNADLKFEFPLKVISKAMFGIFSFSG